MITDVAGVRVGHWTDSQALTGCTVVVLPEGAVASGEVRGGAPGTREWELLDPGRLVLRLDAVVLSGGSAFGLAACDGVMRWCEEQGRGQVTSAGKVPIVVGAVIFDLSVGTPSVRPGAASGYEACRGAKAGPVELGRVGAGTGAASGKWRGQGLAGPGGVGSATERHERVVVSALVVVNAYGDVGPAGQVPLQFAGVGLSPLEATCIGVVATNAALSKGECLLVARSSQDGLARVLEPAHTLFDGDAIIAASAGAEQVHLELVRALAARAVSRAVLSVVDEGA